MTVPMAKAEAVKKDRAALVVDRLLPEDEDEDEARTGFCCCCCFSFSSVVVVAIVEAISLVVFKVAAVVAIVLGDTVVISVDAVKALPDETVMAAATKATAVEETFIFCFVGGILMCCLLACEGWSINQSEHNLGSTGW